MATAKSIFRSKTFWANALALISILGAQPWIATNPNLVSVIGIATTVANVALRLITSEPVKL